MKTQPLLTPSEFKAFDLAVPTVAQALAKHNISDVTSVNRLSRGEVTAVFQLEGNLEHPLFLKIQVRSMDIENLTREKKVVDFLRANCDLPIPACFL